MGVCELREREAPRPPLEELARRGYIKIERQRPEGKGRPSETVTISPAALLKAGEG